MKSIRIKFQIVILIHKYKFTSWSQIEIIMYNIENGKVGVLNKELPTNGTDR